MQSKLENMTTIKDYPKSFSHIGITVPDIKEVVKFYSEVMGWYIIMKPSKVKKEKETAIGKMCIDVFGDEWTEFEIAHLATSDGIGVELFTDDVDTDVSVAAITALPLVI